MNNYTNFYSMSSLFDDLISSFDGLVEDPNKIPNKTKNILVKSDLKYDVSVEKDKHDNVAAITFGFAIPRRKKEDVSVSYNNSYFTVKFAEIKADENQYRIKGISTKEAETIFYVDPEKYDVSNKAVEVKVADGYLTIRIPAKKDSLKTVDYEIKQNN